MPMSTACVLTYRPGSTPSPRGLVFDGPWIPDLRLTVEAFLDCTEVQNRLKRSHLQELIYALDHGSGPGRLVEHRF